MNAPTKKQQIMRYVESKTLQDRIASLYGGDASKAEKFKATLINVALDRSLASCSAESIVKSALAIAEAQLPISKTLGLAYIVPFGKEAQPIISYKGYKHLLRRDGILLKAREVYKSDRFAIEHVGFDDRFYLQPQDRQSDEKWIKDNLIGIWVSLKYIDMGEVENVFVERATLDKLANMSQARNSKYSPYNTGFWLEMYIAKAVGYVARKIGVSGEYIDKAFDIDNQTHPIENAKPTTLDDDILDAEVEQIEEESNDGTNEQS